MKSDEKTLCCLTVGLTLRGQSSEANSVQSGSSQLHSHDGRHDILISGYKTGGYIPPIEEVTFPVTLRSELRVNDAVAVTVTFLTSVVRTVRNTTLAL
jgi:hypothetical protein